MASSERSNTIDSDGSNQSVEKTACFGSKNNNIDQNEQSNEELSTEKHLAKNDAAVPCGEASLTNKGDSGGVKRLPDSTSTRPSACRGDVGEGTNGIVHESGQSHVDTKAMTKMEFPMSITKTIPENGKHMEDVRGSNRNPEGKLAKHSSGEYIFHRGHLIISVQIL